MFVNPFERMKKIREDKERIEKETKEEREKYARLGVQMGLTKAGGVVPSFMQGIIHEEKKQNVPPFGMADSSNFEASAPMPSSSSPQKSSLGKDALKDLSLPGGAGAPMSGSHITPDDNGFMTPDKPVLDSGGAFDSFAQSPSAPTPTMPGSNSLPSTPNFTPSEQSAPVSGTPAFASGGGVDFGQPSPQPPSSVSANNSEPESDLDDVHHDSSFFEVEKNAIDQIDALLNMAKVPTSNLGEIQDIIDHIQDSQSKKQLFAIFGNIEDTNECTNEILSSVGLSSIDIEMKKMYSYTVPYLYVIKAIINNLPSISLDDKRVLWDRVAVFLSATAYGKQGTEIELMFEEELSLVDPMESAKNEFKNVINAYGLEQNQIIFTLKDFRGLEFENMNECILFISDLFTGIYNLKFIFELPLDAYYTHFRLSASKSWLSLFDIVLNTKKEEERIIEETPIEEDVFSGINQSVDSAPTFNTPSTPQPEVPSFSVPTPSLVAEPQPVEETNFSEPMINMQPDSGGPSFLPPGAMPTKTNSPKNHSAVKQVDKNANPEDDAIRISITDRLEQAEKEKQELEELERQQRHYQLLETTIDPSVLVDEEETQTSGSPIDVFANFNAAGYRGLLSEETGLNPNDSLSSIKDERSYEEIREKLTDFSNNLSGQTNITIDSSVNDRAAKQKGESEPAIKISGGWQSLQQN